MGRRKSVCVSIEKDHKYKELVIDILNDLKPVLWPQCCIHNNLDRMEKRKSACASTEKDHQCKELVIDILDDLKPVLWSQCCIYKVPRNLCKINKEVYTPQLISIGPLHHDNEKLADMEMQKSIYLSEFFKRTKVTWKDFFSILKKDEERIHYCYAEKSKRCSNEYVEMILFDAVFIMELFIRNVEKENHQDDYMLEKLWLRNGIQQDLLLLENQLPYFVFDALFKLAFSDNYQPTFHESSEKRRTLTFHELTYKYFKNYNPSGITVPNQKEVLHFTDLLRYFMSEKHPEPNESSSIKNLCSATKLHEAGMQFKGLEKACLTNVTFEKGNLICCKSGTLIMPQFEVYGTTECVIRNLMALEQCHYPSETYICNYIFLMDYLINTADDVDLLVEKGVVNWLGSNQAVAELVNKLCINIIVSNFCHHDICVNLNTHYKNRVHRAMQILRTGYFSNFWRGTATVATVILLVMTLLQTINSF